MLKVHVVTDGCASFADPKFIENNPVTVLPNTLIVAGKSYREGVDISHDEALSLIAAHPDDHRIEVPKTEEYVRTYAALSKTHSAIISVHGSRELFPSWQRARVAAQQMIGSCKMLVVDSRSLCAAQGVLVQLAVKAARSIKAPQGGEATGLEEDFDEIVRQVRGGTERLYSMYCTGSLGFLLRNKLLDASHRILGQMLNVKPLITFEDGELRTVEKVKTTGQMVDRLVEFAVEFEELEHTAIAQRSAELTETTLMIQDRLSVEFPAQSFPHTQCSTALTSLIGTDAIGVTVLEKEMDFYNDKN